MSETFTFGLIGKQDLNIGYDTFSVTLPNGSVATLDKVSLLTFLQSYASASLPAAGHAGQLAKLTNKNRALMMDTGTHWFPVAGRTINVEAYDAVADFGVTDVTANIQAAVNDMAQGDTLEFPATPGIIPSGPLVGTRNHYRISSAIVIPAGLNGIVIKGDGLGSTMIKQYTNGQNCLTTVGNFGVTNSNFGVIKDLWLSSTGAVATAGYGIYLEAWGRGVISQVYFEGWGAAIHAKDSLEMMILNNFFAGGQDGISDENTAGTASNAWIIFNNNFSSQSRYGLNIQSTPAAFRVLGNSFESIAKGAVWILAGYAVSINENYFEENFDGTVGTFDIKVGSSISMRAGTIINNHFASTTNVNHYPIRINNLDAWTISNNNVNQGSHYISFLGTDVINTRFGSVHFSNGTPDLTYGTGATYGNLPKKFVYQGNIMEDYANFPCDGENYFGDGEIPLSDWNLSGAGTATLTRSPATGTIPDKVGNQPVAKVTQTAGSEALLYKIINVGATYATARTNTRVMGKWVTFMLDVLIEGATERDFEMWISGENITIPATPTYSAVAADGWKTYTVSGYVDATNVHSLQGSFVGKEVATYYVANPRMYVGMDPRTMPATTGPVAWFASAAPTTGTWALGDFVRNSSSVGATPTIGWICTVAGTPGTWVAVVAN